MGALRFLLAVGVLFHHSGVFKFIYGGLAVELFFIISGFYMAMILNLKYSYQTYIFYTNRFLRLAPTYYLVFILQLIFIFYLDTAQQISKNELSTFFYDFSLDKFFILFSNVFVIGQETLSYFSLTSDSNLAYNDAVESGRPAWILLLVPQAWSISLEIIFYLIAPCLFKRKRILVLLFISSYLVHKGILFSDLSYDSWGRRFFPGVAHFFFMGMLSYEFSREYKNILEKIPKYYSIAAIIILLVASYISRYPSPFYRYYAYPCLSAYVALLIPVLFYSIRNSYDRIIGELSYPVYMYHIFFFGICVKLFNLSGLSLCFTVLLYTCLFSTATYYWIDQPIDRWRQRRVRTNSKYIQP